MNNMVWAVTNILKLSPTFFVSKIRGFIRDLHRWSYYWTHIWTDKASISGTSFISVFSLTIFTHREGLFGSTPVPDINVNSSTIPNQCAVQQGIYGVTSRVFILVLLGKDYNEGVIHRWPINCHFGVREGITFDPDQNMEEVVKWRYACLFAFDPPSIQILPSPYSELDQKYILAYSL